MRRMLLTLAVLMIVLIGAASLTSGTSTPPFLNVKGEVIPTSVAEERRVKLGGVEQYVLLRGRDRTAPLLVYVHGGPGTSATPFLRTHNAALENDFLVVYWDQRGTGKSFDATLEPDKLSIAQMTADLSELIDSLLKEFAQDQVLLVGHSWGTILALEHVIARPETVAAYIAVSQTTHQIKSDTEGFQWALAQARATKDSTAMADLEALGEPPYSTDAFITQRRYINELGGTLVEPQSDFELLRTALATPEFAWPDILSFVRGNRFSLAALWPEQQTYDAFSKKMRLEVPIILMLGRNDRVISPRLGAEYLEALIAPEKEVIWFEHSAHAPLFEEPEKFTGAVKQIARQHGLLPQ